MANTPANDRINPYFMTSGLVERINGVDIKKCDAAKRAKNQKK